jgi:hypothetical protein
MPEKEIKSQAVKEKTPAGERSGDDVDKKPALYTRVLDEAEKLDFELAAGVDGIDDEIALLRVKIKSLLEKNTGDISDILKATELLVKMVKARYSMNKKQEKSLGESIRNIIKDIGVPLGVAVLSKKL